MTNTTHTDADSVRDLDAAAAYLADVLAPLTEKGILPPALTPALLSRAFIPNPDGTLTPRPWARDLDQLATVLLQHAGPPGTQRHTAHPCPTWCDEDAPENGHPFTYADPGDRGLRAVGDDPNTDAPRGLYRVHRHRLSPNPTHVAVEAWEGIAHPDATSDYGTDPDTVRVSFYAGAPWNGRPAHVTPTGARELARQLLAAADLADAEQRQRGIICSPTMQYSGGARDW